MVDVELLISLVRDRRCLYDSAHHEYKDSVVAANNWEAIAATMNLSGLSKFFVFCNGCVIPRTVQLTYARKGGRIFVTITLSKRTQRRMLKRVAQRIIPVKINGYIWTPWTLS